MASEIPSSRRFHVAGFMTSFLFQDGVQLPLMIATVQKMILDRPHSTRKKQSKYAYSLHVVKIADNKFLLQSILLAVNEPIFIQTLVTDEV